MAQYRVSPGAEFDTNYSTVTMARADYQIQISDAFEDPQWDAFLAGIPGGHHLQTSLWAQVKKVLGWRAERIFVIQAGQIVAGAQLLIRRWPLIGAIGCVPKGPVFASKDPRLPELLLDKLHQVAKTQRLQYLIVQPPNNGQHTVNWLLEKGFRLSRNTLAPPATIQIDLRQDLEEIFAQMNSGTRRYVRKGLREGIICREGTDDDLASFYRLLKATSERQNFSPNSRHLFSMLWQVYHRRGYAKLFLTEYRAEAVAAALVIAFGDRVIGKSRGWTGQYGNLGPNQVMDWTTIEWAKTQGYHYFDLEGISQGLARAILNDRSESEIRRKKRGPSVYKLGFGGKVTLLPAAYEYIYNPILRWGYSTIYTRAGGKSIIKKAVERLRVR